MAGRLSSLALLGLALCLAAPLACNDDKQLTADELAAKVTHDLQEAEARLRNNKIEDAETLILRVLELAPEDPSAIAALGRLRYEQKNYAEAETLLERAIAAKGDNAAQHALLGNVYARSDRHAEAAAAFGRAFELEPEKSEFGLPQGQQLNLIEQHAEAEDVLEKVAEVDPMAMADDGTGVHTILADAIRAQGRLDEALKMYMKAQSTYASDKMARAGAALVYEAKGDTKHALDEWSGYIRMDCCSEYSNQVAKKKIMELGDGLPEQAAATDDGASKNAG